MMQLQEGLLCVIYRKVSTHRSIQLWQYPYISGRSYDTKMVMYIIHLGVRTLSSQVYIFFQRVFVM